MYDESAKDYTTKSMEHITKEDLTMIMMDDSS